MKCKTIRIVGGKSRNIRFDSVCQDVHTGNGILVFTGTAIPANFAMSYAVCPRIDGTTEGCAPGLITTASSFFVSSSERKTQAFSFIYASNSSAISISTIADLPESWPEIYQEPFCRLRPVRQFVRRLD